uniref:Uncharacterized protein n=1 Tax=Moniliophthora roreri TaxID=221103 RepID=A0A0W0G0D2_MONRR
MLELVQQTNFNVWRLCTPY